VFNLGECQWLKHIEKHISIVLNITLKKLNALINPKYFMVMEKYIKY